MTSTSLTHLKSVWISSCHINSGLLSSTLSKSWGLHSNFEAKLFAKKARLLSSASLRSHLLFFCQWKRNFPWTSSFGGQHCAPPLVSGHIPAKLSAICFWAGIQSTLCFSHLHFPLLSAFSPSSRGSTTKFVIWLLPYCHWKQAPSRFQGLLIFY